MADGASANLLTCVDKFSLNPQRGFVKFLLKDIQSQWLLTAPPGSANVDHGVSFHMLTSDYSDPLLNLWRLQQ